LSREDGHRILAKFTSHVDTGLFHIIAIENHHWKLAKGWIALFSKPLRTLDALHLAIVSSEGLELLTADKSLFKAAESLGVSARLIS